MKLMVLIAVVLLLALGAGGILGYVVDFTLASILVRLGILIVGLALVWILNLTHPLREG